MSNCNEIIERLENLAKHAVHYVGEPPFVMSLDDGIALHDAIDLLKAQEPRVLTPEEIRSGAVEVAWVEDRDKAEVIPGIWFRLSNEGEDEAVDIHIRDGFVGARLAVYGKLWRCWTAKPSDEQRKAVKWNG